MNVLHLVSGNELGGIRSVLPILVRGMISEGVDASVLVLRQGKFRQSMQEAGVPVSVLKKSRFFPLWTILQLSRTLRRDQIDVLHTHSVGSNFYGRLAAAAAPRTKVVTTVHTDVSVTLSGEGGGVMRKTGVRIRQALDLRMASFSDAFIAVSGPVMSALVKKGIPVENMRTIPNGIEDSLSERYSRSDGVGERRELCALFGAGQELPHPLLMSVGRLNKVKNYEVLIRSMEIVLKKLPDARLVMIGDGPQKAHLDQLINSLGLQTKVKLAGWREGAGRFLRWADVFVLSSRYEGHPITALEAMYFKKPLVFTEVGGLPELVQTGVNGALVAPDDPVALSEALIGILTGGRLTELGLASYERMKERYSERKMISETVRMYQEILERET